MLALPPGAESSPRRVLFFAALPRGAGATCNSVIHAIMYGYYLLAALGVPCPWKKYITQARSLTRWSVAPRSRTGRNTAPARVPTASAAHLTVSLAAPRARARAPAGPAAAVRGVPHARNLRPVQGVLRERAAGVAAVCDGEHALPLRAVLRQGVQQEARGRRGEAEGEGSVRPRAENARPGANQSPRGATCLSWMGRAQQQFLAGADGREQLDPSWTRLLLASFTAAALMLSGATGLPRTQNARPPHARRQTAAMRPGPYAVAPPGDRARDNNNECRRARVCRRWCYGCRRANRQRRASSRQEADAGDACSFRCCFLARGARLLFWRRVAARLGLGATHPSKENRHLWWWHVPRRHATSTS